MPVLHYDAVRFHFVHAVTDFLFFFQVSTVTGHNVQAAPVLQHRGCLRHHAAFHPFGNVHVQLNRFSVLTH